MPLLETIDFNTGERPNAAIIVLHGLGADGNDFVPVARELDLSSVGAVRFVFPHAPVRTVTINGGAPMRAWYDILGSELSRREDEPGLRASDADIQALIEREVARGIVASRIILMGFSQGCAMALLSGLRSPRRLGGLIGLSGYLPLLTTTAAERAAANHDVPIFMAHGRFDDIVPLALGEASRDALQALGYGVEWHAYPIAHSVCMDEIKELGVWLRKVLASA